MRSLAEFEKITKRKEPLAAHTSFRIGGPADFYVMPVSLSQLAEVADWLSSGGIRMRILGGGTNLLVSDRGVGGAVISLRRIQSIEFHEGTIIASAGTQLRTLVSSAVRHGIGGLEFLAGIPGTVGGALVDNAGAWGRDISSVVDSVLLLGDGGLPKKVRRDDLQFAYRRSNLRSKVILSASFCGPEADPAELTKRKNEALHARRQRQPVDTRNAGCVFKNPEGKSAGELIDQAGLKGARCGGAVVSPHHANFIINDMQATCSDVLQLMDRIKAAVRSRFGTELEPEIELWQE